MKRALLLFVLLGSITAFGQTGTYLFSRTVGTYSSIAGGPGTVATTTISGEDDVQTGIPIGFTFSYCGTDYTQLSASTNGWLSLVNSAVTDWHSFQNHDPLALAGIGGGVGLIMPYWDDLKGTGSTAYYQTSGSAPTRVFTFQWGSPSSLWHSYLGFGDATFQVKLYETSGVIEFIYGTSSYSAKTATIGLCNSTSDFRTLPTEASVTPSATFYYLIDTTPELNTIMEWAPPCPTPPSANTGTDVFCEGSTTTLSNPDAGGTWSSNNPSLASVGSGTGVVTGEMAGIANISYKVSPGCFAVTTVTVNPLPDTIAGSPSVCEGASVTFGNATTGGTWSSTNTTVGTISTSGAFSALAAGTTTISYELVTTCARTLEVTVNPLPVITGSNIACIGDTTVLDCAITGGTWASGSISRATVDAYGNVVGVSLGTVIITYTAPSGCKDTILMTVQTDCTDGINGLQARGNKLNIYPHPTNGDFYMSLPISGEATITISDLYGKTVIAKHVNGLESEKVYFSESSRLAPGNYILRYVAGELVLVSKLIIAR
jgi:hypothetical protein